MLRSSLKIFKCFQMFYYLETGRWHFRNYIRAVSLLTENFCPDSAEKICPIIKTYRIKAKQAAGRARELKYS